MAVLEYERRFHDLSMFAPYIVPTKQYRIQKMRDGLRQDLKQALIPHRFETTRELIDAAEALETCMKEGQQGQSELGKRKEFEFTTGRPPFFKKRKGQFTQFKKGTGTTVRSAQSVGVSSIGGHSGSRDSATRGGSEQKPTMYPQCGRCNKRHPSDCSMMPGRCYICRGEHLWKECSYLGRGCYYCGAQGHWKRNCPRKGEFLQRQQAQTQSQQHSITINRPVRPAQSGASGIRGRARVQDTRTPGRVYNMMQEDIRAASDVVAGMLQINSQVVYALIDPGATHSFVANRIVEKLGKCLNKVDKGFIISTPLGETVNIDCVYK